MRCLPANVNVWLGWLGLWSITAARDNAPWMVISRARDVQPAYDFLIVGGGTAGLTVADRLTEDGKTSVLVIEHGELGESSWTTGNVSLTHLQWTHP